MIIMIIMKMAKMYIKKDLFRIKKKEIMNFKIEIYIVKDLFKIWEIRLIQMINNFQIVVKMKVVFNVKSILKIR